MQPEKQSYFVKVLFLTIVAYFSGARGIVAEEEIPFQTLLDVVIAGEASRQHIIQYDVVVTDVLLKDANDLSSVEKTYPKTSASHVRFDPKDGRFFTEMTFKQPGETPESLTAATFGFSSDGKVLRQWVIPSEISIDTGKVKRPNGLESPGTGFIAAATDEKQLMQGTGFLALYGMTTGLPLVAPNFWPTYSEVPVSTLSSFLRSQHQAMRQITTVAESPDVWLISTEYPWQGQPMYMSMSYNIRIESVVSVKWANGKDRVPFRGLKMSFTEIEGVKVPKIAYFVTLLGAHRADVFTFSNQKVLSRSDSSAFVTEIPKNIHLEDHINERSYVTGGVMENERE
jgi:hypothetical protein